MKWSFCNSVGKKSKTPTSFQIDIVGNIVQQSGGVKPKACQKCKLVFKAKVKEFPLTQNVPIYKCANCKFENSSGDAAFLHNKAYPKHNVKSTTKQKPVGIERKLIGTLANIKKTKDDIIIICSDCHDK